MDGFYGLLFILIIWLCIGVPIAKMSQAKKQGSTFPKNKAPGQADAASVTKPDAAPDPVPLRSSLAPSVAYGSHDDSIYAGSMNAETGEGYDPCHEQDLNGLNKAEAAIPQPVSSAPALPFGWTGSDMVKGIVISEILKRK